MIRSPSASRRLVVPRWRTLISTIASHELALPTSSRHVIADCSIPPTLVGRLEAWRLKNDPISAAEVVESAIVHGREHEGVAAARSILQRAKNATPLVLEQATSLLQRIGINTTQETQPDLHQFIRVARARTRLNPRDALSWVDLSFGQVSALNGDAARRSMAIAIRLAPHNRHVLRSAARLFLHLHDPELAHDVVRRNRATPSDPWLMAAEIAIAPLAERTPFFIKAGTILIEKSGYRPRVITELASAIGTQFVHDGNNKKGRRLFHTSVIDPTGNSLAQAEWVSQRFHEDIVDEAKLKTSTDAREALSMHLFRLARYEEALVFARSWIDEEPFSARAHVSAAAAAGMLELYGEAIEISRRGLNYDPKSLALRNSLAYSLASAGELNEAAEHLAVFDGTPQREPNTHIASANRGLVAFRNGDSAKGVEHYQTAMAGFRALGIPALELRAKAYLARESARARLPNAAELLKEVTENNLTKSMPELRRVIDATERYMAVAVNEPIN